MPQYLPEIVTPVECERVVHSIVGEVMHLDDSVTEQQIIAHHQSL